MALTNVVNLYGGPGTGKSTYAAYMYYLAKCAGVNAELVREYVKDWAWEGRSIGPFDQLYFMGKQIRKETLLYGKVDFVVTDSPNILPIMYSRMYSPGIASGVQAAVEEFYRQCEDQGVTHHHVFLKRSKPYNPAGRYQSEDEAKELDSETERLLQDLGITYDSIVTTEDACRTYLVSKGIIHDA